MDYGKAIRIARAVAGIQQKELAELVGVDPSHISLMEVGKRKPSVETLEKISRALGLPERLFLLLAAEEEDLKLRDPKELQGAVQALAEILLRHATHSRFRDDQPLFSKKT